MITHISGKVVAILDQAVVVDMNGLGLHVAVAQESQFQVGSPVTLYAYMHWNQEQGPSLFGFSSELEKAVFLMVIDCSGIGPKIGLAVLGSLGAERFIEILQSGDERALSKVSGIGPKKAEQMIVQLKHKVGKLLDKGFKVTGSAQITNWQNIQEVLESLNYSRPEITATMRHLRESEPDAALPFDNLMRKALSFLAKNK
ncbi:MAG: Holliday junction ATP-dependent DNA helicase RuvA [Candidatus Babeliales bacterium]|nr:Holliday junction ATP-dependent DNA helicase RuvA [Candidatus Babeliales bacterium]